MRREREKVATVGSVCGREPGLDKGSIERGLGMNRRSLHFVVPFRPILGLEERWHLNSIRVVFSKIYQIQSQPL